MTPWYRGFKGDISLSDTGNYTVSGKWKKIDKYTIQISELPIKRWTRDYKALLEDLIQSGDL